MNLPNSNLALSPCDTWLSLADAAARLGQSEGHTRRRAGSEWFSQGKARKLAGQAWEIRGDADPALVAASHSPPSTVHYPLSTLSAKQRAKLNERQQILAEWQQAKSSAAQLGMSEQQATERFILSLHDRRGRVVSARTLYLWAAKARDNDLLDGRSKARESTLEFAPFIAEVHRLWLRQSRPGLKTCYDFAKLNAQPEWKIPSIKTVQRATDLLDERLVILKRFGETAFKNAVLPNLERDYTTLKSNECWVSDHMQFDVIVNIGTHEKPRYARPWLTSWEDCRSRKIVGFNIAQAAPSSTEILLAIKRACISAGIPDTVYMDNGKDYDAWVLQGQTKWERKRFRIQVDEHHFTGALGQLGCTVMHARPHNPESKQIEPWHRTVHARFDKFQATYCGSTTDQKPEDLYSGANAVVKWRGKLESGQAPLFADFCAAFNDWLEADYHTRAHSGQGMDGMTPNECWAVNLQTKKTAPADHLELLLQRTSKPVTVTKSGVTWGDRGYGRGDSLLDPWFGKVVYLRVGDDVTEVSVWTIEDRLIGRVRMNGLSSFLHADEDTFKAVARDRKRIRSDVKAGHVAQMQMHTSVADLLAEKMNTDKADKSLRPAPRPGSLRILSSPLNNDDVDKALSQPLRKAVGAERFNIDMSTGELLDCAPEPVGQTFLSVSKMSIYEDGEN